MAVTTMIPAILEVMMDNQTVVSNTTESPVTAALPGASASTESSSPAATVIVHCHNLTRFLADYLMSLTSNLTSSSMHAGAMSGSSSGPATESVDQAGTQKSALIYIVVVLFFYSFGIGFMMIKYMRKEAKEQEECKKYRRYINAAHEQYLNSTNRARLANRLALQALNTVNAIPQTTQFGSKVTFV